jgi:uncharacterized protein
MGHRDTSASFGGESGIRPARVGTQNAAAISSGMTAKRAPAARVMVAIIRAYQALLSPVMASPCKFYPSCSRYAAEAIEIHGARRGGMFALKRLLRCRPGTRGGVDFVPEQLGRDSASQWKECAQ